MTAARTSRTHRVPLGAVDEFPVDAFRVMEVDGTEIGVLRTGAGAVHAVRNRCPHAGAPICRGELTDTMLPSAPGECEAGLQQQVLRCLWHQYEFDVTTGKALFGSHRYRLRVYPAAVEDGTVVVTMPLRRRDDQRRSR